MRRKVLQDHANTLCQMFVGWRMVANDIPTLVRLGHGPLAIDVLAGTAECGGQPVKQLYIAEELRAWFEVQLVQHGIPRDTVTSATLNVDFDASRVPRRRHDRYELNFDCRSAIENNERTYVASLSDRIEVVNVRAI